MNTTQLKTYAPKARRAFIAAIKAQAAKVGVTAKKTAAVTIEGDILLVDGQAFPRTIEQARRKLIDRVRSDGFESTMEAIAYTWFNRFAAIRYMEIHGYLEHGYRVLSHPQQGAHPEILDHAADVDLPGLDKNTVIELKLGATRDEELYRILLKAQCNALHQIMPFLFDPIGSETELLIPANLLHSDSLIQQMVESIDEDLWQDIEIIGWLYQFYISEKKDEVIGKVVKSEDLPAATQLFTPNWIVKYMVQNSLGAQWLATYPHSQLKKQMEYYIEPAEQTDEVNEQLAAITPNTLNPEDITLIDPACGSGHILVEAYDLFKSIYLERGYRQRDVAKLILEKNLFGLDIDERAAQLTGFALMMKGRADDRRLFARDVNLNVIALQNSTGFDVDTLAGGVKLEEYGLTKKDLAVLKRLFEHATTFGSLVQVPEELVGKLPELKQLNETISQDMFVSKALNQLGILRKQAELLAAQYDVVAANPPYMGSKGMNSLLKKFTKDNFVNSKDDLFACFIERGFTIAKTTGYNAMVTMQSWMFLSSFEKMRKQLLRDKTIQTMVHMSNGVMGIEFGTAATVLRDQSLPGYVANYSHTSLADLNDTGIPREFPVRNNRLCSATQSEFTKIPGSPVAYWLSNQTRKVFIQNKLLKCFANPSQALVTGNTERYIRGWWEISLHKIGFSFKQRELAKHSSAKWFPYNKGGTFRSWYGNHEYVVNWENDGHELRTTKHPTADRIWAHNFVLDQIFREAIVWSKIGSGPASFRFSPDGFLYDDASGVCSSISDEPIKRILAFLVSPVVTKFLLGVVSPTMNMQPGNLAALPYIAGLVDVDSIANTLVTKAKADWDSYERSWEFQSHPLLTISSDPTIESSYVAWTTQNKNTIAEMKHLKEENNRLFIDAYGLQDELAPDVPIEQITLTINPSYRYPDTKKTVRTEEERWKLFRQDTMKELISYAVGCMMGRYSLDTPGLIYAHSGNKGFDHSQYSTFPADDDGIVPVTDTAWFDDDACQRFVEFISVTWDAEHLEENLTFIANNLKPKKSETSRETIRRWLCDKFFKHHHIKRYKKRPIYWLFSSGKKKAFQCLVYLHRYNEGTLARMRSEYIIPLQSKMAARIEKLQGDIHAATSTAHSKRLEKELSKLETQQIELVTFDEKLRHYADLRISLDLDDGVKVNYGKFGDLLAEVKDIHGKMPEAL